MVVMGEKLWWVPWATQPGWEVAIFLKTYSEKTLDAHARSIVVLTGGMLTGIYFLHLLYAIYFSVTTNRWKGKNVNFVPPGDVNPRPHPLKTRLTWGQWLSCGSSCVSIMQLATTAHPGHGDLGMYCVLLLKMRIHSRNIYSTVCVASNAWPPLGR
jgi:hypothetical protein